MPTREQALPGRAERLYSIAPTHVVLGSPIEGPWPDGSEVMYVAMGCFWGTERIFWRQPGVIATAAGYMGGHTPNPTYEEVCTGLTGHAETVRVVYDPQQTSPELLLKQFWENHDPTTANRQGNDVGTGYRSAIYWTTPDQERAAAATREAFQQVLHEHGHGEITTEIRSAQDAGPFYVAEDLHQGYLHKNPMGYCNHGPNGMTCPVGIVRQDELPSQKSVLGQSD
ncbi:MAG: peptide-methionine (S)-S-oxide reductase MsrA [Intrasporangium sp.]|uniref:peptide-methionine (S)-S-oxide reductase MsrA n=1 Tax=Intrasporangium sp. TaxID=1925024 RepID=UPI002647E584|nr:peptide-methionine (S)-S-oxide reductase MsrA [Intrasporangium sp.]MDN5798193.1 peptide-methionine (S)-S-oxide reductase MsrA [Intrasporangium sp.]